MTRRWFVIAILLLAPTLASALKILEPLTFDRGSATLRKDADPIIAAVADVMIKNPSIALIEVAGHVSTDDAGTDAKRLELSDHRAAVVGDRLVALGVARGRLRMQGYGDTRPVDTHATNLAASKNRRVDFVILVRRNAP
jgi:OOP family OmpA-OmpF porin